MTSGRTQWFADVLRAGIDTAILSEPDVLTHVPPSVLIAEMPAEVIVGVLETALDAGTISPKAVLQTVTPELLSEHVAHRLLWACVAEAAERAGIPGEGGSIKGGADGPAREFLRRALDRGRATGVISPADIVRHVNPTVITHHFPDPLKVKLLEVTLAGGKMTPEIVVDILTIEAIAQHAPTKVAWACVAEAGGGAATVQRPVAGELASDRAVTVQAPADQVAAAAKRLQFVEEDVDAALDVDLDDVAATIMIEQSEPSRPKPPAVSAAPGRSRDKRS
jgi:hypothetical protein